MNSLPKTERKNIPDIQRSFFEKWLLYRHIEAELKAVKVEEDGGAPSENVTGAEVKSFDDVPLEIGQIRMLSASLTPNQDLPVMVAVFSDWNPLGVLVAPFSRYPVPALPGEMLTLRDEETLRVLNVWNSYSLPRNALKQSWLVEELDPKDCSAARAVFRHAVLGETLAEDLEKRIGPPILHPDDPRRSYQLEELESLEGLQDQQVSDEKSSANLILWPIPSETVRQAEDDYAVAAADASRGEMALKIYSISDEHRLHVNLSSDGSYVDCLIIDQAGDPSSLYDGAYFETPIGKTDLFAKGRLRIPVNGLVSESAFYAKDGKGLDLHNLDD